MVNFIVYTARTIGLIVILSEAKNLVEEWLTKTLKLPLNHKL